MSGFCMSHAAFTRLSGFNLLAQLEKKLGILQHAFLEAERFAAGRVGLGGCRLAELPAQVTEVLPVWSDRESTSATRPKAFPLLPGFRRHFQRHPLAVAQHDDVHGLADFHSVER